MTDIVDLRIFDVKTTDALVQWGARAAPGGFTGRNYTYRGGIALDTAGAVTTVAAGSIVVADNATSYVERGYDGTVSTNTTGFTASKIPMAVVTALAGAITAVDDWRPTTGPFPYYQTKAAEVGVVSTIYPYGTPERHGASANLSADATVACQRALDAAAALQCHFLPRPGSRYKLTAALDATAYYGVTIKGGGFNASPTYSNRDATHFIQYTDNLPILRVTGPCNIDGIYLAYANQQPDTNTAAIGLELNKVSGSSFRNIRVYNAAISFGIPQVGFGDTSNWMFDSDFSNLQSYSASLTHYDFRSLNGGSTNCRFGPLYVTGGGTIDFVTPGQACKYVLRGAAWSGFEFGAISIDATIFTERVFDTVNCFFTIDTIRHEAVTTKKNGDGWYNIGGSNGFCTVNWMLLYNCRSLSADGVNSTWVWRANATSYHLEVRELWIDATCNITTATARVFQMAGNPTSATSLVRFGRIVNNAAGFNSTLWTDSTPSGAPAVIREWSGQTVADVRKSGLTSSTHVWEVGSAPPTTGTWAQGDRRVMVAPGDVGRAVEWVCVAAGTPGTWVPVALLGVSPVDTYGDVDATLTPTTSRVEHHYGTALTANRTITLATTNAWNGCTFKVVRKATATGAFTLSVGGLVNLGVNQWCRVTYDGFGWRLTGLGPLTVGAAITAPTAPSATYVQAEATSIKTAIDAIRAALTAAGITV